MSQFIYGELIVQYTVQYIKGESHIWGFRFLIHLLSYSDIFCELVSQVYVNNKDILGHVSDFQGETFLAWVYTLWRKSNKGRHQGEIYPPLKTADFWENNNRFKT